MDNLYTELDAITTLIHALDYVSEESLWQLASNPFGIYAEQYIDATEFLKQHIESKFVQQTKQVTVLMVNDFPLGAYETEEQAAEAGQAYREAYDKEHQGKGFGWKSEVCHHFHYHTYQVNAPANLL